MEGIATYYNAGERKRLAKAGLQAGTHAIPNINCHPERSHCFANAKQWRSRRTPFESAAPAASQGTHVQTLAERSHNARKGTGMGKNGSRYVHRGTGNNPPKGELILEAVDGGWLGPISVIAISQQSSPLTE